MKVGIITLYFNYNYGAILQAYALQKAIKQFGYVAEDIRYYREIDNKSTYLLKKERVNYTKLKEYFLNRQLGEKIRQRLKDGLVRMKIVERQRLFDLFLNEEMDESLRSYDGHKDIHLCIDNYDIFVCGSDNIWNKNLLDTTFMLEFVPDDKLKIAYAPGMSTNSLSEEQKKIVLPCVSRIDYLSCRESIGADLLTELTGRKVQVVLDPTLLLDSEDYKKIERKPAELIPNEFIFCYFCGDESISRIKANELSESKKLPIVTFPHVSGRWTKEDSHFGDHKIYKAGSREFIYLVRHAKYVCTDSFHGTVFSIIFKKPFLCFRRFTEKNTKSLNFRIDNILRQLEIDNQYIIEEINESIEKIVSVPIDWGKVHDRLNSLRTKSITYLQNALNDFENKLTVVP